jgi:protein-tyrosine kinase
MDKVRQALDRAREERAAIAAGGAQGVLVADEPGPAHAPGDDGRLSQPSAALARALAVGADLLERNRVLQADDRSEAAQAFRMLRTQVLQRMREHGWRTLGIVSARSLDGKTTVAANLAVAISADPRHTAVLVDLDLHRPAVARLFGASGAEGIDEVLHERATVDSVMLRPTGIDRLRLLPAQDSGQRASAGLVARPSCEALLAELKGRYTNRIIVVDMPPVLDNDDALTLAPLCDCLLFVVSEGRTARADVSRALTLLGATPVLGTVLNNCSTLAPNQTASYG